MLPAEKDGTRRPRVPRIILLLLLGLLLVASVVGLLTYHPTGARTDLSGVPTPASRRVAVFIGDSYTHGTGASDENHQWTSLVARAQGWNETNLGLGGTGYLTVATTNGCGQKYCANFREVAAEAVDLKPDVVVVAGGQNDLPAYARDPKAVSTAINETFQTLRRGLPEATIVAVGPSTPEAATKTVVALDASVQEAASGVTATYISLISPEPAIRSDMVMTDGVHVDDSGHRAIADRVLRGLR